jgi:hypothetical protein
MANQDALKDGNRTPTMLFEQAGETRRVSSINPLPVALVGGETAILQTATAERIGPGEVVLVTPTTGKRAVVRGVCIAMETATGGEADVRFGTSLKVIHKIYRGDQSGGFIEQNSKGAVNEVVKGVVANVAGGAKVFFIVNYLEE